ncbi:hypothetical protein COCNU_scaffold137743G000010 [Cocos nucifera]|nr:hypothetical protein [Cocos nucifera]
MAMTLTEADELLGRLVEPPEENWTLSPPRPRLSQSRLHNFSFLTRGWGCHKLLRCMNNKDSVADEVDGSAAPAAQHDPGAGLKRPGSSSSWEKPQPPRASPGGRRSKEVNGRAPQEGEGEESSSAAAAAAAAAEAMRPWNLRARRAACNAPAENGRCWKPNSAAKSPSPLSAEKSKPLAKSVRLRSDVSGKGKRPRFSISLSREEIEGT